MHYTLDENKQVIPAQDFTPMTIADKRVGLDETGKWSVSTVFLQIDHNFGEGPPLVFETMVFPKKSWLEEDCQRYSTWDEAVEGHIRICAQYNVPTSLSLSKDNTVSEQDNSTEENSEDSIYELDFDEGSEND